MKSNPFTLFTLVVFVGAICFSDSFGFSAEGERPNILIITVDDMNADSIGAFGCQLKGTTPNIDRLAKSGLSFSHAHVQVGNCMPSRNVMWSGLYPHNNRVEGFYQVKDASYPTLTTLMNQAGYFTAIRHKVSHSSPFQPYPWGLILDTLDDGSKAHVKDASSYGVSTARGIEAADKAGKPFCLVINIADPHKPFYAQGKGGKTIDDPHVPPRVFKPSEVPIPGFLFEDAVVRKELAHYYSSVSRCDDAVGSILEILKLSGKEKTTLVMFLSDHGMPLPFAKTQLYHHSTHTPLIVRWPGVTKPATEETTHMVSAVDFLPTLLDVAKVAHPEKQDGRSFASIIKGKTQEDRDFVIKEYNENAGASRDPMRAIQTKKYLYLFNPWSNGERVFATATSGTQTYRRMVQLAASDPAMKTRLDLYRHRVVEELYDVENDPDCLVNLIDSRQHQATLKDLRDKLESWMKETKDPMLDVFRNRDDAELREAFVVAQEKEAEARRRGGKKQNPNRKKNQRNLISLKLPAVLGPGSKCTVVINHKVPRNLGEQQVHVTLKGGKQGKRIERKIVKISGQGESSVEFDLPETIADNQIRIAAFVGPSFLENMQYLNSDVILVKKE